jgi:hypothetical protein
MKGVPTHYGRRRRLLRDYLKPQGFGHRLA